MCYWDTLLLLAIEWIILEGVLQFCMMNSFFSFFFLYSSVFLFILMIKLYEKMKNISLKRCTYIRIFYRKGEKNGGSYLFCEKFTFFPFIIAILSHKNQLQMKSEKNPKQYAQKVRWEVMWIFLKIHLSSLRDIFTRCFTSSPKPMYLVLEDNFVFIHKRKILFHLNIIWNFLFAIISKRIH